MFNKFKETWNEKHDPSEENPLKNNGHSDCYFSFDRYIYPFVF